MNTRIRPLAALSLALVAAGCGMFSDTRPSAAPQPDAAAATLVLYRVHLGDSTEGFTSHNVYLDGAPVGHLNEGEELRLTAVPGVRELSIQPETKWLGSARQAPLKYSLELTKGSIRYLRYRTATGAGRLAPVGGGVYADRELNTVTEPDYAAKR